MRRAGVAMGGVALAFALVVAAPEAARAETAVLQGLDKITARISTFEAPVDQPAQFGSLEITVRRCQKTPPEEPPESAAFMEIVDNRPDSPSVLLFSGWMFASSPAVSALEHPVYDVWVVDCLDGMPGAPGTPATLEAPTEERASGEPATEVLPAAEPQSTDAQAAVPMPAAPAPRALTLEELEAMEAQRKAQEGN